MEIVMLAISRMLSPERPVAAAVCWVIQHGGGSHVPTYRFPRAVHRPESGHDTAIAEKAGSPLWAEQPALPV